MASRRLYLEHVRLAKLLQALHEGVVLHSGRHLPVPPLVHVQQPPQVARLGADRQRCRELQICARSEDARAEVALQHAVNSMLSVISEHGTRRKHKRRAH